MADPIDTDRVRSSLDLADEYAPVILAMAGEIDRLRAALVLREVSASAMVDEIDRLRAENTRLQNEVDASQREAWAARMTAILRKDGEQ